MQLFIHLCSTRVLLLMLGLFAVTKILAFLSEKSRYQLFLSNMFYIVHVLSVNVVFLPET